MRGRLGYSFPFGLTSRAFHTIVYIGFLIACRGGDRISQIAYVLCLAALYTRAGLGLETSLLLCLVCALCAPLYEKLLRGSLPIQYWMTISMWLVYGLILNGGVPLSDIVFLLLALVLWMPLYARVPCLQRWFAAALPTGIREGITVGSAVFLLYAALMQSRIIVSAPATVTMLGNVLEPAAFYALFGILVTMGTYATGHRQAAGTLGVLLAAVAAWAGGFLAMPTSFIGILPVVLPLAVPLDVPSEPLAWAALPVLAWMAAAFYRPMKPSVEAIPADSRESAVSGVSRRRMTELVVCLVVSLACYPVLASIASLPSLLACVWLLVGARAISSAGGAWHEALHTRCAQAAFFTGCIFLPLSFHWLAGLSLQYIVYAAVALLGGERGRVSGTICGMALVSMAAWLILIR